MQEAVVGLGSNLGDSRASLGEAIGQLRALGTIAGVSALYATAPIGPPQPEFLNAACRLMTELAPHDLLDGLLAVERSLGRVRRERWGPRCIDLDILWMGGLVVASERLGVPHPELRRRAFALCPLLDVVPDATDPRDGVRYADVLSALGRSGVRQISASFIEPI